MVPGFNMPLVENSKAGMYEHHLMFMGFGPNTPAFPRWLYRDGCEPRLVENADQEAEARAEGWDNITAAAMSNRYLVNWFWDLEDFSPKQLVVFAKDEFDVDLPIEAGQNKLFQAVTELARHAPQNRNRLVLMAHTIEMNYDATLEEIKRLAAGDGQNLETETETFDLWL